MAPIKRIPAKRAANWHRIIEFYLRRRAFGRASPITMEARQHRRERLHLEIRRIALLLRTNGESMEIDSRPDCTIYSLFPAPAPAPISDPDPTPATAPVAAPPPASIPASVPAPVPNPDPALAPRFAAAPGLRPVSGYVQGPTPGPAMGAFQGPVRGSPRGPAPGCAQGPAPGYNQRPAPGSVPGFAQGPAPGYAQGPASGIALGRFPGPAQGPVPGYVRGPAPGYTQGPVPGFNQGPAAGHAPGYALGPALGPVPGPVPRFAQGPPPGYAEDPSSASAQAPGPGSRMPDLSCFQMPERSPNHPFPPLFPDRDQRMRQHALRMARLRTEPGTDENAARRSQEEESAGEELRSNLQSANRYVQMLSNAAGMGGLDMRALFAMALTGQDWKGALSKRGPNPNKRDPA